MKHSILRILCTAAAICLCSTSLPTPVHAAVPCDLDGNGDVALADAVLLARYLAEALPPEQLPNDAVLSTADLDSDGLLTVSDLGKLLMMIDQNNAASFLAKCSEKMALSAPADILTARAGVTYPKFQKYSYASSVCGYTRNVNVLLPANYDAAKRYPVLYVLHGVADNEDWMAQDNVGLSTMLNNLIADGAAREIIVVSPYIYCSPDGQPCTAIDDDAFRNFDRFREDLVTDLMPFIESNFAAAAGRENTAVTGFSLGGREALNIGFKHPEKFGYVGSICAAWGVVPDTGALPAMQTEDFCFRQTKPYLLLMSAAETDYVVGDTPYRYHNILTDNGTAHLWQVMTDSGHDVRSVSSHMYNFFRMAFQAET